MTFEVRIEISSELGLILYSIIIVAIIFMLGYITGISGIKI